MGLSPSPALLPPPPPTILEFAKCALHVRKTTSSTYHLHVAKLSHTFHQHESPGSSQLHYKHITKKHCQIIINPLPFPTHRQHTDDQQIARTSSKCCQTSTNVSPIHQGSPTPYEHKVSTSPEYHHRQCVVICWRCAGDMLSWLCFGSALAMLW